MKTICIDFKENMYSHTYSDGNWHYSFEYKRLIVAGVEEVRIIDNQIWFAYRKSPKAKTFYDVKYKLTEINDISIS